MMTLQSMVEYFVDFAERLGHWGYFLIFLVVALECQAFVGLFMPGETLVIVAGFLAGRGIFDLDVLIATVSAAAIVGDSIGYELGRHLGRGWLLRSGRWIGVRQNHLQKVDGYFRKHGGKSVFFSHFMHFLRAVMPFMAGSSRMGYTPFLFFNALGCIVWASTFTFLGYFFGESWRMLEKWMGRAAAIIGALLVLGLTLAWLWQWISRHETELKAQWQVFTEQRQIVSFRHRFASQIRFLQDRLTPGGYLGLHLTIGVVVIILSSWWFGGIVQDLIAHDPLVEVDKQIAIWLHEHATPALTRAAVIVTSFGSPAFLTGASLVLGAYFLLQRAWRHLLALVLTMGGGSLLNVALKSLFQRERPIFEYPLLRLSGYSFPSGHAMGATLFYGFLAVFVMTRTRNLRWRVMTLLLAFLIVVLVGFTRIYLGAHYLSDVMGAMAAGLAWLAFCVTAVETLRIDRRQ